MSTLARRYRRLLACLAIALQVVGVAVGALGHSHTGPADCCSVALGHADTSHQHHHGSCSHSHEHPAPAEQPTDGRQQSGGPHDDCSLCRHFSQAVSPVTLVVEVPRCERVEACPQTLARRIAAATRPSHPARGPPSSCA